MNLTTKEKLVIMEEVAQNTAGAANAPSRTEIVGKYVPSPDADITEHSVVAVSATDMATDSNNSVLGTD